MTFGHLVGEVARRVDGRTVGGLLREELPWLDFRIGLTDAEQERCADVVGVRVDADGFGMGGIGGSLGAASRSGRYGIGFLPAYMIDHGRADRLESVLRECLGVPPLE